MWRRAGWRLEPRRAVSPRALGGRGLWDRPARAGGGGPPVLSPRGGAGPGREQRLGPGRRRGDDAGDRRPPDRHLDRLAVQPLRRRRRAPGAGRGPVPARRPRDARRRGRAVYAPGSGPGAARLAGIRPRRVVFGVFVVMGALAGLAALLNAVRFSDVDPNSGLGLELQVIAAVVVGGAAVSGGRGTLAGTLVGVALLGSIGPALVFLHTQPQWEKAIQGMIILLAVASDAL